MPRALLLMFPLVLSCAAAATAAPHVPAADSVVVERLPYAPGDPALRDLRALQARLKDDPENLPLAVRIARGYLAQGRKSGDPRYVGYAQAALAPWWDAPEPPVDVALLRAAARQRIHQFAPALRDLQIVLERQPGNAQARLMRATILQVTGSFAAARADCAALPARSPALLRAECRASVDGMTGRLHEGRQELESLLDHEAAEPADIRGWVVTLLAEMAEREGRAEAAEQHFLAARAIDPDDVYLLSAYADFLLDAGRAKEVESLLRGKERIDPLLLRLALAAKAGDAGALPERVAQLRERFDASRMRGEAVHLREEARFRLFLLDDARGALELARENWRIQKEPADLRILIEAARAAGAIEDMRSARAFIAQNAVQDFRIEKILMGAQPD